MSTATPNPQVIYVEKPGKKNGLGISSFILGLVATVIGLIPIMGIPALASALVGLGLGLGNIGRTKRHEASKTWTILGIIFSVLGVILAIVGIVIVSKAFNQLSTDLNQPAS